MLLQNENVASIASAAAVFAIVVMMTGRLRRLQSAVAPLEMQSVDHALRRLDRLELEVRGVSIVGLKDDVISMGGRIDRLEAAAMPEPCCLGLGPISPFGAAMLAGLQEGIAEYKRRFVK